MRGQPLLEARAISKVFHSTRRQDIVAIKDISLAVERSEIYGLLGESGSGKSTLARIFVGIESPSSGEILLDGKPVKTYDPELFRMRRRVQYVFQDPFASLPPHMSVRNILEDPLIIHKIGSPSERDATVEEFIELVGLKKSDLDCFPAVFSGGQRQRVSLARALVTRPDLVICDEVTSGLDVSIPAQILNLLLDLNRQLGIGYLFISHDLRVVRFLSDRVGVMRSGELIEEGLASEVLSRPSHPYTREMIASVPHFDR